MTETLENGIVIRPIRQQDKALVEEFFAQMGGETRGFFNGNGYNGSLAKKIFTPECPPNHEFYLAEKDGLMVGYIYLWDTHTQVPDLGICIRENCKGMHLGRDLIGFLIRRAKALGAGGLMLTTHVANVRGQGLYSKMGFDRIGTSNDGEALYLLKFQKGELS